jgi:hypothetical protein
MRTLSYGVGAVLVALAVSVAACGDDGGGNKASGGAAGANSSGGASSGSGGANTAAGSGGSNTGGTAVKPQGGGSQGGNTGECKSLGEGETGAHGLKLVYHSESFGAFYSPLGIVADQVYFTAGGKVMSYPAAGGEAKELGPSIGSRQLVRGSTLYGFKAGADGKMGSLVSASLADLATIKTLAEGVAEPQQFVADDAALYFDRREPTPSIFKLANTGGTPEELVPGAEPLGMISHQGNLYWLDFNTEQLERVPVAGGARQKLAEVFFGGPMAAAGNAVYWADTSLNTVEKWEEGAQTTQKLATASSPFDSPEYLAVEGSTVYWVLGFICGEVHQVQTDGSGAALYTQGTDSADWVGLAPGALFVMGRGGLYRAER